MTRLLLLRLLGVCALLVALPGAPMSARPVASEAQPLPAGYEVLKLKPSKETPLPVRSSEVQWRGNGYRLLSIARMDFALNRETGHLQAKAHAGIQTFDNITYPVSVAVFDGNGRLLGTARTDVQVERVWISKTLLMSQTFTLDFGRSLDYQDAQSFQITIGRQKVLTPDDWQPNK